MSSSTVVSMIDLLVPAAIGLAAIGFALFHMLKRRSARLHSTSPLGSEELAELAPAGLWRTTPQGECTYVNRMWKEMAGMPNDEWQGHGWSNAIHPDDRERVLSSWVAAMSRGGEFREELRWQRPDGTTLWVMAIGAPEFDDDGELCGYAGINIDIQPIKDMEKDLQHARERAEREAASKSTFLANMSHEIRTPMNGVIGFTELLMESDLDEDQRSHLQMIADSGRAMMQLLNDILDHSKIESGQLNIVMEPADLRHKLKHCVNLVEPMARAKGLSVSVWIDDAVPAMVQFDRLRLRQVMLNLIGNAIKFTESGGVDVEARVENATDGKSLLISVIDSGIGIDEDRLDAIFSPFLQEDGSVARRYGGTGLGLAISKQLVDMMGGRITVHSKRDVGTQFTIRLPLVEAKPVEAAPAPQPSPSTADAMSCLAGKRVLIAEDHAINQQLILAMAEALGLQAKLVEDGEQAVRAVKAASDAGRSFAAVLMDMQMPGMDGLEATRRLRAQGFAAEDLPIIALTANCYAEDVEACKKAGMQSHLGKPVTTVALARELARWLSPDSAPDGPPQPPSRPPLPAEDVAIPGVSKSLAGLEDRYRMRKSQIVDHLRTSLAAEAGSTDWGELAKQLHNLAGVAANFGDRELGEASRRLEQWFKTTPEPLKCQEAAKREWKVFEAAA